MNACILLGTLLVLPGGHSVKTVRRCDPPMFLLNALPAAVAVTPKLSTTLDASPKLMSVPVETDPFKKPVSSDVDQAIPVSAISVERDPQSMDFAAEQALAMADGIIDGIPVGLINRFNTQGHVDYINGPNIQGLGLWGLAEIGPGVLYPHAPYEHGRSGGPGGGGGGRGTPERGLTLPIVPIDPGPTQTPEPTSLLIWGAAIAGLAFARSRLRST